ncbi:hypothetical protein LguiB_020378 [Lonicera macranthoides]
MALKEEYMSWPAADETINDPANSKHYWRYHMCSFAFSCFVDRDLKTAIKDLVRGSGRSNPPSEEVKAQAASGKASAAPEQQFSSGQEKCSAASNAELPSSAVLPQVQSSLMSVLPTSVRSSLKSKLPLVYRTPSSSSSPKCVELPSSLELLQIRPPPQVCKSPSSAEFPPSKHSSFKSELPPCVQISFIIDKLVELLHFLLACGAPLSVLRTPMCAKLPQVRTPS